MDKAFEKILDRLEDELTSTKTKCGTNVDFYKGICKSQEIVQQVAEEYNGGWIPCSERLPEKEGKYLVTLDKWNIVSFADFKNLKYNPHFNAPVIAWQPLPEPYKERD